MIVYVDPEMPGISRKKVRNVWRYWDAKGNRITDRDEIDRLIKIALPPAYVDAWFCPSAHGHIQAIGYDTKGRRQYRYHADFRAQQEAAKYDLCADFGRALPLLRAHVDRDLAGKPTARDTVLAAVVRLLDIGRIRIGNKAYAQSHKSFGATTLRNRHAKVVGSKLSLQFRAKSGVLCKLTLKDKGLLRVVRRVQDLPGPNLFQYLNDDGTVCPVGSADVNAYIKAAIGEGFTAKHFRTWNASVIALEQVIAAPVGGRRLKRTEMLAPVAEALGNTPAIARKSYVHPRVLALCDATPGYGKLPRATRWLSPPERALIALLDEGAEELSKAA